MSELKPCPFCGSPAATETHDSGAEWFFCSSCKCAAHDLDCSREEWNTRPAPPALDRLKEEIASGPHHLMCTSRMRGHNCNCWRFRALRIIEELKQ